MDEQTKREIQRKLTEEFLNDKDNPQAVRIKMTVDFLDQLLTNYIVIGYDFENQPFIVGHNKTPKDCDALKNLVHKVVTGQDLNMMRL